MTLSPPKKKIVIVGGGIIGVTTAYFLSRHEKFDENVEITIVEGSDIASGASGKAGGLLAVDWHGPTTSSLALLSYNLHASLAKEYDGATNWGFRQLSTLSISADLTAREKKHSKVVEGFTWLDKQILTDVKVIGTTDSNSQVHPKQFTLFLSKLAQEKGVKIVFATVNRFVRERGEGKGFTLHATTRDSNEKIQIQSDVLLLANGPWVGELLKKSTRAGSLARNITGSRAHSIVIKASKPLPAEAIFTSIKTSTATYETQDPEIYNRPDSTSYVCGPVDSSPLPSLASLVTTDPEAIALLVKQAASLSPDYLTVGENQAQMLIAQACYLPVGNPDPIIGEIEDGLFVAGSHTCWGIQNGPGTGLCMAELLLDGKVTSADISALAP